MASQLEATKQAHLDPGQDIEGAMFPGQDIGGAATPFAIALGDVQRLAVTIFDAQLTPADLSFVCRSISGSMLAALSHIPTSEMPRRLFVPLLQIPRCRVPGCDCTHVTSTNPEQYQETLKTLELLMPGDFCTLTPAQEKITDLLTTWSAWEI